VIAYEVDAQYVTEKVTAGLVESNGSLPSVYDKCKNFKLKTKNLKDLRTSLFTQL